VPEGSSLRVLGPLLAHWLEKTEVALFEKYLNAFDLFQEKGSKKKRKRCGECNGCQRKDNCGDCAPCRNDKSHQICKIRRCERLTEKKARKVTVSVGKLSRFPNFARLRLFDDSNLAAKLGKFTTSISSLVSISISFLSTKTRKSRILRSPRPPGCSFTGNQLLLGPRL
jgi:hypothetical protein